MSGLLLLDIGNSRIKAAVASDDGALQVLPALAHQADAASALARIATDAPTQLWISQVLGAAAEASLIAAVQARWNRAPHFARATSEFAGLRSGYGEPARLGVDRWLAMLAARSESLGAVLVVDAGTALTADLVDASGQHRGGFIAGGLLTAQRGVLGATRFATRDTGAGYDGGLGLDTEACVRQGAMLGCLGAIDRAADLAEGLSRRMITGGDAEILLPHLKGAWQHRPNLVLEGLLIMARHTG
ncbi:MAG: type pantothenate kinase [Hydrocarboniphaga sp.]|uniref:type III pantothenate kinase n=1 Tax=Hydrocarboniphaga sp. TaxID=2033016 RepID=UPI00260807D7|nr:type III pantothenate kinase [Hydrocarboniphaga sp.]MDB5972868.1 type pantothenate kinase [Hydrocarboniphaga sp.]